MASVAIRKVQNVVPILWRSPPIFRMSSWPLMACMTLPAARNSSDLKKACVIKWKIPAANTPAPQPRNMYPSWLMVE